MFAVLEYVCCSGVCLLSLMDTLTQCSARCSSKKIPLHTRTTVGGRCMPAALKEWKLYCVIFVMYATDSERPKSVLYGAFLCHRFWPTQRLYSVVLLVYSEDHERPRVVICGRRYRCSYTPKSEYLSAVRSYIWYIPYSRITFWRRVIAVQDFTGVSQRWWTTRCWAVW